MAISPTLRWSILERDNFTCQYCGAVAPEVKLQLDHLIPRSKGGKDELNNLVTACSLCNIGKNDKELMSPDFAFQNDMRYVMDYYTDRPSEALRLVRKVRNEAVDRLILGIDASWQFTIWRVARLMPVSNFEFFLLASLYDEEHIHAAMHKVADEVEQGLFPKHLDRIITRVGQYAQAYHHAEYGMADGGTDA